MSSKVPSALRAGLLALFALTGGGMYVADVGRDGNEYIQAVAADTSASMAVKAAMVMGSYYESGYKHIGTPYVDKLGKGQPLTVCNGITGRGVVAGKWYSPAECYALEKGRYLESERIARNALTLWPTYTVLQQASFIDFIHNKGAGAFQSSTMLAMAQRGDIVAACRQNMRWNKGTVNGVLTVLPGLKVRADANAEICEYGLAN